jgi:hypothetical protein
MVDEVADGDHLARHSSSLTWGFDDQCTDEQVMSCHYAQKNGTVVWDDIISAQNFIFW